MEAHNFSIIAKPLGKQVRLAEARMSQINIIEGILMATNLAGSYPSGASQQELDLILNGDYKEVFRAQDYFSVDDSTGHIFDVMSGDGMMRSDIDGDKLMEIVKVS